MRFTVNGSDMKIAGRALTAADTLYLGYSGSSVTFVFEGTRASACIVSDPAAWGEGLMGRIAVYVDGAEEPAKRICLDKEEAVYTLYECDMPRRVTITVMKYSEAAFGLCGIRYIETDSDTLLPPPASKARRMEIIGDSITCGYGVEAKDGLTPFHTETENPTKSYSLLTAKALDAEVNLVSWSGNGIISKWVPEDATEPLTDDLMSVLYPYTDLSCSKRLYGDDAAKWERWDFSRFIPEIILVNLGTNDCSWCRDVQSRKDEYRDAYVKFLELVRACNPQAEILCMLGTMDQRVLDDLEKAVCLFAEKHGDKAVHFLSLPMQNPADGYGADWHPCVKTQRDTAALVVSEVKRIMNW